MLICSYDPHFEGLMIAIRVLVRRRQLIIIGGTLVCAIVTSLELLERVLKPSVNLMSLNVHVG